MALRHFSFHIQPNVKHHNMHNEQKDEEKIGNRPGGGWHYDFIMPLNMYLQCLFLHQKQRDEMAELVKLERQPAVIRSSHH